MKIPRHKISTKKQKFFVNSRPYYSIVCEAPSVVWKGMVHPWVVTVKQECGRSWTIDILNTAIQILYLTFNQFNWMFISQMINRDQSDNHYTPKYNFFLVPKRNFFCPTSTIPDINRELWKKKATQLHVYSNKHVNVKRKKVGTSSIWPTYKIEKCMCIRL